MAPGFDADQAAGSVNTLDRCGKSVLLNHFVNARAAQFDKFDDFRKPDQSIGECLIDHGNDPPLFESCKVRMRPYGHLRLLTMIPQKSVQVSCIFASTSFDCFKLG